MFINNQGLDPQLNALALKLKNGTVSGYIMAWFASEGSGLSNFAKTPQETVKTRMSTNTRQIESRQDKVKQFQKDFVLLFSSRRQTLASAQTPWQGKHWMSEDTQSGTSSPVQR
jgi:hypothetical protein